jgi:hypothetical protein
MCRRPLRELVEPTRSATCPTCLGVSAAAGRAIARRDTADAPVVLAASPVDPSLGVRARRRFVAAVVHIEPRQRTVATTSRYSSGRATAASPERLLSRKNATRSAARDCCPSLGKAANAVRTGPKSPRKTSTVAASRDQRRIATATRPRRARAGRRVDRPPASAPPTLVRWMRR